MSKEKERGMRKRKDGVVFSNKMQNTAIVKVETSTRHPLYGKIIKRAKKYYAHVESGTALNEGDKVTIEECRPLSKLKKWRVVATESN